MTRSILFQALVLFLLTLIGAYLVGSTQFSGSDFPLLRLVSGSLLAAFSVGSAAVLAWRRHRRDALIQAWFRFRFGEGGLSRRALYLAVSLNNSGTVAVHCQLRFGIQLGVFRRVYVPLTPSESVYLLPGSTQEHLKYTIDPNHETLGEFTTSNWNAAALSGKKDQYPKSLPCFLEVQVRGLRIRSWSKVNVPLHLQLESGMSTPAVGTSVFQ